MIYHQHWAPNPLILCDLSFVVVDNLIHPKQRLQMKGLKNTTLFEDNEFTDRLTVKVHLKSSRQY